MNETIVPKCDAACASRDGGGSNRFDVAGDAGRD